MEPLCQKEETGESTPPGEAVVASICSATKELQQSVQDLCKDSLEKITYICQYLYFFSALLFPIWFSISVSVQNTGANPCQVMLDIWRKVYFILIKNHLLFIVKQESTTVQTSNSAPAAAAAEETTDALVKNRSLQSQSTGAFYEKYPVKVDINLDCTWQTWWFSFSIQCMRWLNLCHLHYPSVCSKSHFLHVDAPWILPMTCCYFSFSLIFFNSFLITRTWRIIQIFPSCIYAG